VQSWNLREIDTPGGTRSPVVLRSDESARAVLIVLEPGQALGDHQMKERALVSVVDG
jgi:quercetin dioxygenase-like cupin family protein